MKVNSSCFPQLGWFNSDSNRLEHSFFRKEHHQTPREQCFYFEAGSMLFGKNINIKFKKFFSKIFSRILAKSWIGHCVTRTLFYWWSSICFWSERTRMLSEKHATLWKSSWEQFQSRILEALWRSTTKKSSTCSTSSLEFQRLCHKWSFWRFSLLCCKSWKMEALKSSRKIDSWLFAATQWSPTPWNSSRTWISTTLST